MNCIDHTLHCSSKLLTINISNYVCWQHIYSPIHIVLDDRNYYEMSSFVETRAERVMKNKATSAKFIKYDDILLMYS